MNMITVKDLHKNYTGENALAGVSFTVKEGEIFGIIGADGAGKTTLLRILATLINADKGTATVKNFSVVNQFTQIRENIGYMPQRFSLYQDLSVKENLSFFADVFGVKGKERSSHIERLLTFSRLKEFQNRRAAHLSGGMKQKLALSCALIHTPKILILDEPTTGVDPVSRKEFWDILKELHGQGITIIVSTPYMDEALLCDSLMILHKGELLTNGTPDSLLSNYPCDLYALINHSRSVYCPKDVRRPKSVQLIYPSGGALHVALDKGSSADEMFNEIKLVVENIEEYKKIRPSIEDLFFLLLSQKELQ